MATIIQLSETTYLNLDNVTVLRCDDGGRWRVFFADHEHPMALTAQETLALAHYIRTHAEHTSYRVVNRGATSI